ncbi:MAG TPA: 4-hydroxy-3-methylbut-2-enyl diphosphate reductase [Firmicutes bacterium]|nr:4-hydroxy-3-methylbut-2-enyl diphosphate reductase [Bacillota bacterium]
MKIEVLQPSGYCIGVSNAIKTALKAKEINKNKKISILGMLVHNEETLEYLKKHSINTIYSQDNNLESLIDDINENDEIILSAHGHSQQIENKLNEKGIKYIDATCPFVKIAFENIKKIIEKGHQVIYIGKKNHPEANAALSISKNIFLYELNKENDLSVIKDEAPIVLSQTTFLLDDVLNAFEIIKSTFPNAIFEGGICKSSLERQNALLKIKEKPDVIYIIGSKKSNNTKSLFNLANKLFSDSIIRHIENEKDVHESDLKDSQYIVISSGASTPDYIIDSVIKKVKELAN